LQGGRKENLNCSLAVRKIL